MKTYPSTTRDEFYRDKFICVDLLELYLTNSSGGNDYLYLCTGGFPVTWNGNTYTAQGDFVGFSTVNEDFDLKVGKFSIYLSALAGGYVNKFINTDFEGKRVVIRKAFLDFDPMTLTIIDSPIIIFDGQIYNVSIVESRSNASITVECSTLFADFERTAGRKTSNGSNWLYQGSQSDLCFEKSGYVGTTEFLWGRLK
jgi:hypothetical protein